MVDLFICPELFTNNQKTKQNSLVIWDDKMNIYKINDVFDTYSKCNDSILRQITKIERKLSLIKKLWHNLAHKAYSDHDFCMLLTDTTKLYHKLDKNDIHKRDFLNIIDSELKSLLTKEKHIVREFRGSVMLSDEDNEDFEKVSYELYETKKFSQMDLEEIYEFEYEETESYSDVKKNYEKLKDINKLTRRFNYLNDKILHHRIEEVIRSAISFLIDLKFTYVCLSK